MKRAAFAFALAAALAASAAFAAPPPGQPDLVITSFGLASWGTKCSAGETMFTFSVGVKNQGTATWAGPDRPSVTVGDMHLPNPDDWGTGVAIDPPIKPGETRQIQVPVKYYAGNPTHMLTGGPHPYHAKVNRDKKIPESDFTNNDGPGPATWNGMKVIQVGAPSACQKAPAPIVTRAPAAPAPTPVPPR